jgi:hypothetical protein
MGTLWMLLRRRSQSRECPFWAGAQHFEANGPNAVAAISAAVNWQLIGAGVIKTAKYVNT